MGLNHAPFPLAGRRAVLLSGGEFSIFGAKTAVCYVRYRPGDVVAVVDDSKKGRRVEDVLGFGGDVPVVGDVEAALARGPEVAIVGVAPAGGRLDTVLKSDILRCVEAGLDVASGLHDFLAQDADIAGAARRCGARLWDVREVPPGQVVGTGGGCTTGARCVLVAGSDCNVGKMTATVELYNEAVKRGIAAAWAATGQTGMMLRGRGIAVDRVVADFIGGAAEELVNYEGRNKDLVFVEGQGSIVHPGFAGVTLGLMYGVMPDCMVMVHAPSRDKIGDSSFDMPGLAHLVALYESVLAPLRSAPVVAIALNTVGLEPEAACGMMDRARRETGLPVADPVRTGATVLLDAVMDHLNRQPGDRGSP